MQRAREFLESPSGKIFAAGGAVIALLAIFLSFRSLLGPGSAASLANRQTFICAKTGKSFELTLKPGMRIPVHSSYSGEDTGYPAELCYWTASGGISQKSHPVLMNSIIGKPEPTFCPDCGRLVVRHNPRAAEGRTPPPLKQELMSHRPSGAGDTTAAHERQQ